MPPQRSKTVQALLAGAERAFAERGFHGASIGYICSCANRTTGAFYSNYDSKLQLFLDVYRRHGDRIAEDLERRVADLDAGRDLAPQLARVFAEITTGVLDDQWLFLAIEFRLTAIRDQEAAAALLAYEERFSRRVGDMLEALFDRAGSRPVLDGYELAALLAAVVRGVKIDRGVYASGGRPDPLDTDAMVRALEGLFLRSDVAGRPGTREGAVSSS